MDKHEAKAILACYRPGRDDPRDPEFSEALERARQDPELARWLHGQTEHDAALHRQFTEIPVPPFLRDRILAEFPARPARRVARPGLLRPDALERERRRAHHLIPTSLK